MYDKKYSATFNNDVYVEISLLCDSGIYTILDVLFEFNGNRQLFLDMTHNEYVNDFRFFLLDPDESNTKLQFLYNNEDLRVNVFEMLMYIIDEHDFEYKKYQNKEIVELQTDTSTYEIISEVTSNGLLTNTALINKKYPNLNVLNTNKIFNKIIFTTKDYNLKQFLIDYLNTPHLKVDFNFLDNLKINSINDVINFISNYKQFYGKNKQYYILLEDGNLYFLKKDLDNEHQKDLNKNNESRSFWPENYYDGKLLYTDHIGENAYYVVTQLFKHLNIEID